MLSFKIIKLFAFRSDPCMTSQEYVRLSFELYKKRKTILVEHLVVLQAGNLKTK